MDNQKFWNERYMSLPESGSGPVPRGYAAWFKQELIEDALATNQYRSLLDIGCGDHGWLGTGALGDVAYAVVDISDVVVKKNKEQSPEYQFLVHDIAETAFHGELAERIKETLPNAQGRTFGAFRFQTVYEVTPSS